MCGRGPRSGCPFLSLLLRPQPVDAGRHPHESDRRSRAAKVVGYPPLCEMSDQQRRDFHEALLDADAFEDLAGKWQAAILEAEQSRPKRRVVSGD
jgi:hypothetical protein